MCLGIPGKVIEIVDPERGIAKAEVDGVRRNVSIDLVQRADGGIQVGDWILIHVGFALSKIDEAEAEATQKLLSQLGSAYEEELDALAGSRIE